MPLTRDATPRHYQLKPGEEWWVCPLCKRPLGKLLADGRLEIKHYGGVWYVTPDKRAGVTAFCHCTSPPHEERLILFGSGAK